MRKLMTKEIQQTIIQSTKIELDETGAPQTRKMPDEILLGNVSKEKAQKHIDIIYKGAVVYNTIIETNTYEMEVEKFIQLATIKEDK